MDLAIQPADRSDGAMMQYLRLLIRLRNRYLMTIDIVGLVIIPPLAMLLRTEDPGIVGPISNALMVYTLVMLAAKTLVFVRSGLYSELWAYASIPALITVMRALALSGIAEIALFFGLLEPTGLVPANFPRSIPIISSLLTVFWISGSRLGIRILFSKLRDQGTARSSRRVLIAGAGAAGALTIKELQNNLQLGFVPVGFVDDDPRKISKRVHGVMVFGPLSDIPYLVKKHQIDEVIITMPTAPGKVIREVVQYCRQVKVPSKTIPALYDVVRGTARIDDVRSVQLEDLLRRGVIETDTTQVMLLLTGAKVLVTGAGGSIGSELCRQIKRFRPAEMILLGHGETSIFQIMKELGESPVPDMRITPVIADVRDEERMEQVFRTLKPDVVFHAAAHKHVYLMQENIPESVTNNVLGTRILVGLADRYNVRRFVMVSSDKAVNPTSVMGVTKRIAELIVQDAANRSGKAFVTVRFGNVLGSRGSVVPLFKHQIAIGGPLTVTHPEVTRYFMTIPEAVQLILQAATMGEGGEVFVLDMGEQIKVIDLARDLIRLSGFTEDEIEIKITGLIPGEKMFEELFYETDHVEETAHSKVMVCRRNYARDLTGAIPAHKSHTPHESRLSIDVSTLIEAARQGDVPVVSDLFHTLVPQYNPTFQEKKAIVPRKKTGKVKV
jgi:FlaA1/EpsC-like NDP-sugar epimerase